MYDVDTHACIIMRSFAAMENVLYQHEVELCGETFNVPIKAIGGIYSLPKGVLMRGQQGK
jgi:hypothetical protein